MKRNGIVTRTVTGCPAAYPGVNTQRRAASKAAWFSSGCTQSSNESRTTPTTVAHGVVTSPDSHYAFVSSEGVGAAPGRVDVFDLRTFSRVGSVDVAHFDIGWIGGLSEGQRITFAGHIDTSAPLLEDRKWIK